MLLDHERKNLRMNDYDYSGSGYYFVTICIQGATEYFGDIQKDIMCLNEYGTIACRFWEEIPKHYTQVELDEWIIMPNHVHGIIIITDVGTGHPSPVPENPIQNVYQNIFKNIIPRTEHCSVPTNGNHFGLISKIVKKFKELFTKKIREDFNDYEFQWQRSFHDEIIKNDTHLNNVGQYIQNNPMRWYRDRNNNAHRNSPSHTSFSHTVHGEFGA